MPQAERFTVVLEGFLLGQLLRTVPTNTEVFFRSL